MLAVRMRHETRNSQVIYTYSPSQRFKPVIYDTATSLAAASFILLDVTTDCDDDSSTDDRTVDNIQAHVLRFHRDLSFDLHRQEVKKTDSCRALIFIISIERFD